MHIGRDYANPPTGRLYYEVAGSGPPLILIHGFALDIRMWDDQIDAFAAHYQVIRYDSLGFGRSSLPTGPYSPTADQAALMDYLGIERAHILGLSRGGGIAIDFALAYPTRTLSLIPIDAILHGHRMSAFGDDLRSVWSLGKTEPLAVVKDRWLGLSLFAPAMEHPTVASRLRQMTDDYSGWHWRHRDEGQAVKPPASERLADIIAPTLVIVGERDLPDFHAVADRLTHETPHARKTVLPGVGHVPNMEDPSTFNRIVLDFLNEH